jgi:cupin 2 domain-containing protein
VAVQQGSLLKEVTGELTAELFETLAALPGARIERIVSTGQTTPPAKWYDQAWDEWVLVVVGAAEILVEGEPAARRLAAGDWLLLPRGVRHRVTWTDPQQPTVWLAVHCGAVPDVR